MFLLRMLMKKGRGGAMDPLHVSMTGVRMGERFLQIGCHDRSLLAGLAAKVGLSGTSAVAAFNEQDAERARKIGAKVGALIEIYDIGDDGRNWAIGAEQFDMVVIDDTASEFWGFDDVAALLRKALASLRAGGRIEVVTKIETPHVKVNFEQELAKAGFKPVRVLAERNGLRFVEGLRTS